MKEKGYREKGLEMLSPRTRLAPSRRCSSVLRPSISASRPRLASGFKVLTIELALATLPLAALELGSQGSFQLTFGALI
ncbi:hypothetical protein ACSBR2_038834 [Camellia fascicularis]